MKPRRKLSPEQNRASCAVLKPSTNQILFCPLFEHQKSTDVCTVLRAKRICKYQCVQYFAWAKNHKEEIKKTIDKYSPGIRVYLKKNGGDKKDLIENILPVGEHVCEFCGKVFVMQSRLKNHQQKKHRRQVYEQTRKVELRENGG